MASILWFRRDLRLGDNPALAHAVERGPVLPVFIYDDRLWQPAGQNRRAFLNRSLEWLNQATGDALVLRFGEPSKVLVDLCRQVGATEVVAAEDYGPVSYTHLTLPTTPYV